MAFKDNTGVITENDKNYVWLLDDQKKAKKVEVTLGNADADNQEITSGLTDGAKVISNPTSSLEEGKEVKADEETNQSQKYLQELSKW